MVTALPCYVGLCTVATIVHAILTEYVSVGLYTQPVTAVRYVPVQTQPTRY